MAPEPDAKPLTKKEQKKQAKLAEQSTTASVNTTTNHFLSRRKGKSYSWMQAGASTPSTPRSSGAPGTPGPSGPTATAALTSEGRYRLGSFREDGLHGKGIQLRDFIQAMEKDSLDERTLQLAYDNLDAVKAG